MRATNILCAMFLFLFVIRFRFGCPHTKSSVHINNVGFVCQRLQCTNFQFSNCQTHFEFYAIRRIHSSQYFHFVQQISYLSSRISHSPINNIYNIDTSTLTMKERKNLYPFRMLIKIWATNQSKDRFFFTRLSHFKTKLTKNGLNGTNEKNTKQSMNDKNNE